MCGTHNCLDFNPSAVDSNILGEGGDCDTDNGAYALVRKTHNCLDFNPSAVDSNMLGEGDCDTDYD